MEIEEIPDEWITEEAYEEAMLGSRYVPAKKRHKVTHPEEWITKTEVTKFFLTKNDVEFRNDGLYVGDERIVYSGIYNTGAYFIEGGTYYRRQFPILGCEAATLQTDHSLIKIAEQIPEFAKRTSAAAEVAKENEMKIEFMLDESPKRYCVYLIGELRAREDVGRTYAGFSNFAKKVSERKIVAAVPIDGRFTSGRGCYHIYQDPLGEER